MSRFARIIFRREGAWREADDDPTALMFDIDHDYRPTTSDQCDPLAAPIAAYLTDVCKLGTVRQLWLSVPDALVWANSGQEIVVDGGVAVGETLFRIRAELHYESCGCAHCQDEDVYLYLSYYLESEDVERSTAASGLHVTDAQTYWSTAAAVPDTPPQVELVAGHGGDGQLEEVIFVNGTKADVTSYVLDPDHRLLKKKRAAEWLAQQECRATAGSPAAAALVRNWAQQTADRGEVDFE
jgi:hypothetical protein